MSRKTTAFKRAEAFINRWGDPAKGRQWGWEKRELGAIEACRKGVDPAWYSGYSCSEQITIALGLGRHDLLPAAYQDPVDAWRRLDTRQRSIVCGAIGEAAWMESNH